MGVKIKNIWTTTQIKWSNPKKTCFFFQFGMKKNRNYSLLWSTRHTSTCLQVFLVFLLLLFYLYCPRTGSWFSHSGPTTKNIDNIPKHSANQFQCWSPSCPRHNLKAKRHSPCCEWDFGVLSSGHQMPCHNETLWCLLSDRALFLGKSPAVWERSLACRCSILSFNFHLSKIYKCKLQHRSTWYFFSACFHQCINHVYFFSRA